MRMTLRFSVLASGSTGNAFYIASQKERLLVDAGLSGKQLDHLLSQIQVDPRTLTGILVTHEYSDHIKGLGIIARKYNLPIYANQKTWAAMERDRKSTRLNSSHVAISYAVFCLKKKNIKQII